MSNVIITGIKSNIAHEFIKCLSTETVMGVRVEDMPEYSHFGDLFVFCQGFLLPKTIKEQTEEEKDKSMWINYKSIKESCDMIFEINENARVCILGSESGYKGSYDGSYAKWKKEIHEYIETKELKPNQQLVGIAPTIVEDTKMTQDRKDVDNLNRRRDNHPMKRFLTSEEVGKMIYTLLYEQPYINKTVIRMHGGEV